MMTESLPYAGAAGGVMGGLGWPCLMTATRRYDSDRRADLFQDLDREFGAELHRLIRRHAGLAAADKLLEDVLILAVGAIESGRVRQGVPVHEFIGALCRQMIWRHILARHPHKK